MLFGVGVINIFGYPWKNSIITERLIFVKFVQCVEARGRVDGHSPHYDWPVFSSYSAAFLGAAFAGTFSIFFRTF